MSEEVISKEKLEERYKKVIIRTEETVTPFDGKATKRYVIDLIHDGSIYYIHIEFSPYGATYSGDMGEFMFQPGYGPSIFRGNHINPGYWGEKINAAGREYYNRRFSLEEIDKAFKEEILNHYEGEWSEDYFEEAKKAWEMSDEDFENWRNEWSEKEDESDFVEEVKKIREAEMPSFYCEGDSGESHYLSVQKAAEAIELDWDFETIGYISEQGKEDDYRFLYACCVLQWVANKILKMEEGKEK